MHDLSDGFAIIGPRSQPRRLAPSVDPEAVQLRSDDGEQHITITPAGDMTCRATTSLTLEAPLVWIKGALAMTSLDGGETTATLQGTLTASVDVISGNISGRNHTHRDVQPGPGSSGAPQ
jgi:hypothetical protein